MNHCGTDKCYFLGCVKNCSIYIDKVFDNIRAVAGNFSDYKIVVFYDTSDDDSLEKLFRLKGTFSNLEIIINTEPTSPYRTYNIAHARNKLLEYMYADGDESYQYFAMVDMDDIFSGKVFPDVLATYLMRDDWDALSFNRAFYYDTWAVSIDPYIYSCWHFGIQSIQYHVMATIRAYMKTTLDAVPKDQLLTCYSAFNGFSIYRRSKFIGCAYDGNVVKTVELIEATIGSQHVLKNELFIGHKNTFYEDDQVQDCEHRHFHFQAIKNNGARIRVSPLTLMGEFTG